MNAASKQQLIRSASPTAVRFTTSTATPPPPLLQPYDSMEQQNLGEGTSAAAQDTAPVATASTAQVTATTSTATMAARPVMVGSGADSTFELPHPSVAWTPKTPTAG